MQSGKRTDWYSIIYAGVMALITTIFGVFVYKGIKQRSATKPMREANWDAIRSDIGPKVQRVMNQYPEKDVTIILQVGDKTAEGSYIPWSFGNSIVTKDSMSRIE